VAGVLLVFGQIDYQNLGRGTTVSIINESWWWVLVTAGIAAFGMLFQMAMRSAARLPQEKWVPANSAA
jgi:hypothetical protein